MRFAQTLIYIVATILFTEVADAFQAPEQLSASANSVATHVPHKVVTRWNIQYGDGSEPSQVGNLYKPAGLSNEPMRRVPAVLMIHGGAWSSGDKFNLASHAKKLAARGFVVFSINYRLAPQFRFPAQLQDCTLALNWLQNNSTELQIDTDRVGVWGYSAGGHLAALLTFQQARTIAKIANEDAERPGNSPAVGESFCTQSIAACVCGATPFDLPKLAGNSSILDHVFVAPPAERMQSLADASPIFQTDVNAPPIYLFHGCDDAVVPVSQSVSMLKKLKGAGIECELEQLEGMGHLSAFIAPVGIQQSFDFLVRILQPDSAWLEGLSGGE